MKLPRYNVDGMRYYHTPDGGFPSVTTILSATQSSSKKAGLAKWRDKVGEAKADRIRDQAAERGNRLHLMIEGQLGENPPPEPDCPYWRCAKPVVKRIEKVEGLELPVWNGDVGYAGTLDCLAWADGKLWVYDWKGSNKPKREEYVADYKLQAAAYVNAVPDTDRANIVVIVRGKKAVEFKMTPRDISVHWGLFRRRVDEFRAHQALQEVAR